MMRATSPSISLLSVFVHPPCSLHALGYVQCEPMHTHWCKLLLLGNNLRKEQQEQWHLTRCLQASGKWASGSCKGKKKTSQTQPHPHHPKLEAARLGLLHLRHLSHCAQVRLLAPVLVIVFARDHVSVYDQPLSKPLSHLLHDPDQVKLLSHVPCLVHVLYLIVSQQ